MNSKPDRIFLILIFNLFVINILSSQCTITNVSAAPAGCIEDEFFSVTIDFDVDKSGEEGFSIVGNGNEYGVYSYDSLPVVLDSLPGNCVTPWEFLIRDVSDPSCSNFFDLGIICCSDVCEIRNLVVETDTCEGQGFSAVLDFEHTGTLGVGFDIFVNDKFYGYFSYEELPLRLEDIPHGLDVFDRIRVCDNDNPDCCAEIPVLSPCSCAVFNIKATLLPCNGNGQFGVVLDFDYQNTSPSGFIVGGNGTNYGTYLYEDLPIKINQLEGNNQTNYEFLIVDLGSVFCFDFINIGYVDCESSDSCVIENLNLEVVEIPNENSVNMILDFDYAGSGAKGFTVVGNGNNYGNFEYSDVPLSLGPFDADCETIYEFAVTDLENGNCRADTFLQDPVCILETCSIENIEISELRCETASTYSFLLDFTFEDVTNEGFDVLADNEEHIGHYLYADLPVRVESFPKRDLEFEFIKICDNDNSDCCRAFEFRSLDCRDPVMCSLDSLIITTLDCEGSQFDFQVENPGDSIPGNKFKIYLDDVEIAIFDYSEFPVPFGPFEGDGVREWKLDLVDQDNPDCMSNWTLAPVNCMTSSTADIQAEDDISVFYNPDFENLSVKSQKGFESNDYLQIFNVDGQRIRSNEVSGRTSSVVIDLAGSNTGVYFLKLLRAKRITTTAFVVIH